MVGSKRFIGFDELANVESLNHPIDLEHVEIVFKPKAKYLQAMKTIQELFELVKETRLRRVICVDNYENDFGIICIEDDEEDDDGIILQSEELFNAINILTGELDLEQFINVLSPSIRKKHIKKYVKDKALREKLLLAYDEFSDKSNKEEMICNANEYLMGTFIPTFEKIYLTNYFLGTDGTAHIIFNSIELSTDFCLKHIGKLLGTLAEEITDVVYIDSREKTFGSVRTMMNRKFEKLDFDIDEDTAELVINNIRVPYEDAYIKYMCGKKYIEEDNYSRKDVRVKLIDLDVSYNLEIEVEIKEELRATLEELSEILNVIVEAIKAGKIQGYIESFKDVEHCALQTTLDFMNYDYNMCRHVVNDISWFESLKHVCRPYTLEEIFSNIDDKETVNSLLGNEERFINNAKCDTMNLYDVISCIGNIYTNQIDAENGKWRLSVDIQLMPEVAIREYFKKIIKNIGKMGGEAKISLMNNQE